MCDRDIEVSFGDVVLTCSDYQIISQINNTSKAKLRFNREAIQNALPFPYLKEVKAQYVTSGRPAFKGSIVSVSHKEKLTEIELEGGVELKDTKHSGIAVRNVAFPELFYSFTRLAGIPDERLKVDGLDNSVKSHVAFIPIKGLKVRGSQFFGNIEVIDASALKRKIPKTSDKDLWEGFFNADSWLVITIQAKHFVDAEEHTIEEAESFLALYSGLLQYSYSKFEEELIQWHRGRETQNLRRQNYIFLVCLKNKGSWLRCLEPPPLSDESYSLPIKFDIESMLRHQEYKRLPVLLWNRLRDSEDHYIITVGMWQVLEVLCTKVKMPKRLTKSEAKALRELLQKTTGNKEYEILDKAISDANFYQINDKLDKLLKNLNIKLSEREQELLKRFRKARNDIEHGRNPGTPSKQEIKEIKGVVNRILIEALSKSS